MMTLREAPKKPVGTRALSAAKLIAALSLVISPVALHAAPKSAQPSTLPMRPGYYAELPQSCAVAVRELSGMVVRARAFEYMDVAIGILRVVPGAKGSYTLTERAQGEGGVNTYSSTITMIDANGFVRTHPDFGNPKGARVRVAYRFCAPAAPRDWNR